MIIFQESFDYYGEADAGTARMLQGRWSEVGDSIEPTYGTAGVLPRSGTGMMRVRAQSGSAFQGARLVLPSTYTELFVSMAVYSPSLPQEDGTHRLLNLRDNANADLGSVYLQSSGALRATIGASDNSTGALVFTSGTWHHVAMRFVKSATVGRVQIYVDEVLVLDISGANTSATAIGMLRFYTASTTSDDFFVDDLVVNDTGGSYNTGFLGDVRVATLYPRADDEQGWTANRRYMFGNGTFQMDGDEDGFTASDSAQLELGAGDFTLETFVRFLALPTGAHRATFFAKWRENLDERSFRLYLGGPSLNDSHLQFDTSTDGTADTAASVASAQWAPVVGKRYHVAVQRLSSKTVMFVDGVPLNAPETDASTYHDNASLLCVGGQQLGSASLDDDMSINGFIDEVRITRGVARYNATGFVAPSAAFPRSVGGDPDFGSVSLLCGFDSALTDESSFGRALTARGQAARYAPLDAPPGDYKVVSNIAPLDDSYMEAPYTSASNVLTFTGQPANNETVVVDGTTYTFKTVFANVAGNVLIGAAVTNSIDNLVAAINGDAGAGTLYGTGTTFSANASAANIDNDQMRVTANTPGAAGNAVGTTDTVANAAWSSGVTLAGGLDTPTPSSFLLTRLPSQATGVKALTILSRARKTDSGPAKLQQSFVTADDSSANGVEHTLTTSTTHYGDTVEEDPGSLAGLTPASFVAARVRIDRTE